MIARVNNYVVILNKKIKICIHFACVVLKAGGWLCGAVKRNVGLKNSL